MKIIKMTVVLLVALQPFCVNAELVRRTAGVDSVQVESATRVGYENVMYVLQSGAWKHAFNPAYVSSCPTGSGYFDASANPHFVATALAARVSTKELQVYVDESLPKVDGTCQVINMSL